MPHPKLESLRLGLRKKLNRVSKTRVSNNTFSKITPLTSHKSLSTVTHSHPHPHPLSHTEQTLKVTLSHTDPSLTFYTHALTHRLLHLIVLTLSQSHSQSQSAFAKSFDQATATFFFLRGLSKLKKKVSCFVPTVDCLVAEKHA